MNERVAGTEIIVSGRQFKVPGEQVSYEQIVDIWNKLHKEEGTEILGTPGIDFDHGEKDADGVLEPGGKMKVVDGTSFNVDPEHVS